jgi:hypothetical protein
MTIIDQTPASTSLLIVVPQKRSIDAKLEGAYSVGVAREEIGAVQRCIEMAIRCQRGSRQQLIAKENNHPLQGWGDSAYRSSSFRSSPARFFVERAARITLRR